MNLFRKDMDIRLIKDDDDDAARFLQLRKQLVEETFFMRWSLRDITLSVEQQKEQLKRIMKAHLLLVLEEDQQLLGFLLWMRGMLEREYHVLSLSIGIRQALIGRGWGTQLFLRMEQWAQQHGITRLELRVLVNNRAGIALYTRQGFLVEGKKTHAQRINGEYVDEYLMAKLLPSGHLSLQEDKNN